MSGPTRRTPPRLLEVVRTVEVTRRVRRVTFGGAAMAGFPAGRDGAHVKVFFPRGDQDVPELPTIGPDGPIWPPPARRPITRTYSVRRHDPVAGELDIELVLHDAPGPASRWASRARPGDRVGLAGPGGPDPMLRPADHTVFAGDLSALPAISALAGTLPPGVRATAFIAVPDEDEVRPIETAADLSVRWLVDGAGCDVVAAVRAMPRSSGTLFAWLAGEAAAVLALRAHMRIDRGVRAADIYATPYWKASLCEEAYHEERHRQMDAMELES